MKDYDHKNKLIKLIEKAAYRHGTWEIFSDFVEIAAITISNSVDRTQFDQREKKYLEVIKRYNKEEAALFPEMFAELVLALEKSATDILGELFMELELGSKWKGQVFTPMSVCRAMAQMTLINAKQLVKEKGFITVMEPASGGGALIIALANELKDLGLNYQQTMVVEAADLDIKAVYMSYIQFSLLGIPAVVFHRNTLTMETYSAWKTPAYILGGWWHRNQKKDIKLQELSSGQMKMVI